MNQIDDRLLDYILETLKEVVDAVSDLYLKHGISDEQVRSLKDHIQKLEEELNYLREQQRDGEIYREVSKGKTEVFTDFGKVYLAPILTAVLGGVLVAYFIGG